MVYTLHHGGLFIHLDGRAHALEFIHITVAGVPHALRHQGCACRQGQHGGDLGLHIGGETGIGHGLHVGPLEGAATADQEGVLVFLHLYAHFH